MEYVAGYAAIVATAALGWQIISWILARRTRLDVQLGSQLLAHGSHFEAVRITAVNHSDHAVCVTSAALRSQDGSGGTIVAPQPPLPNSSIPGLVEPHDSVRMFMRLDPLVQEGYDPRRPVVAEVTTSTGDT
jgi:hypothetical protein